MKERPEDFCLDICKCKFKSSIAFINGSEAVAWIFANANLEDDNGKNYL
jgi:hypothetical protein